MLRRLEICFGHVKRGQTASEWWISLVFVENAIKTFNVFRWSLSSLVNTIEYSGTKIRGWRVWKSSGSADSEIWGRGGLGGTLLYDKNIGASQAWILSQGQVGVAVWRVFRSRPYNGSSCNVRVICVVMVRDGMDG